MNKTEVSQLIYFLYNSIKANDEINMSKAEEILNELCSPEQNAFLLVADVIADIIFNPTLENDLLMLSAIILYRCKILRTDSITSQYVERLCQSESLNNNITILKYLCSIIASAIGSSQLEFILTCQPSYAILFTIYFYVHEKDEKKEEIDIISIYEYIVKYSLIDPLNTNVEISTIVSGILSYLKIDDDSYSELVMSFFSQLPTEFKYLPIFCELIDAFNNIPDCYEKFTICYEKLIQFSNIENYPFGDKNILDHDISIEYIADNLIKYIDFYLDDYNEEENEFEIDLSILLQLAIKFCSVQDYIKERWFSDIDSFVIEFLNEQTDGFYDISTGFYEDYDQDLIRCHSLSLIQNNFNFTDFCTMIINMIQENESNPALAIRIEEVYYYVLFIYMTEMDVDKDIDILPPIDEDVFLYSEYIRCMTMMGRLLTDEEYIQILDQDTHFIPKILLAQGIAENKNGDVFPNELVLKCIECLIQIIELFQTNADIDLFDVIKKLVLKSQMEISDYMQIILLLKDQWIKYMNNINRIANFNMIISGFLNSSEAFSIIFETFIPLLQQSFGVNELIAPSILLFQELTKKLPFKGGEDEEDDNEIQISEPIMSIITNDIYSDYIIPIAETIMSEDNYFLLSSFFSIAAFYCRIEIVNPLFYQLIISSIEQLNDEAIADEFSNLTNHFVSFVYEYLLINTDENIGKIEIIQKIIEIFKSLNDTDQIKKENILLLILALFCTESPDCAIPLLNSVSGLFDIIFSFTLENFDGFTREERNIYTVMYLLCVKAIPQLYNQEIYDTLTDKFKFPHFKIDTCPFLDCDDPFIHNHIIIKISKDRNSFLSYYHELLSQLDI